MRYMWPTHVRYMWDVFCASFPKMSSVHTCIALNHTLVCYMHIMAVVTIIPSCWFKRLQMDCINNTQCSSPFNFLRLLPSATIPRYTTLSVLMPKIRDPKSKPHLLEVTTDRIMMIECEMRDLPHIRRVLSVLCGGSMCDGCNSASCLRHCINPHMCLPKFHFLRTIDIVIKIPSETCYWSIMAVQCVMYVVVHVHRSTNALPYIRSLSAAYIP